LAASDGRDWRFATLRVIIIDGFPRSGELMRGEEA